MSNASAVVAVIFDLDGVLVDSEAVWNDARQDVARRLTEVAGPPTRSAR